MHPVTTSVAYRRQVEALGPTVDAIQLGDNRPAEGHMAPLAAASMALDAGVDPVIHFSCRDRNQIALQSDLLGAAALGVTSLVLMRGDKLPGSAKPVTKGVFEIGAAQLIGLASRISKESQQVEPPGFLLGSLVTVFDPGKDWEPNRVTDKIDAGSQFLQTQPCLNMQVLQKYMSRLVSLKVLHRAAVIVDLPLISSPKSANDLKSIYPGLLLPDAIINRIGAAKNPRKEGISVCAELLTELATIPGVAGVNILFDGEPDDVIAALGQADLEGS